MKKSFVSPMTLLFTMLVLAGMACQFALSPSDAIATAAPEGISSAPADIAISQDFISQQDALVSLYDAVNPGVVSISVATELGGGQGSGFVYDSDGNIVTNYHVVQGATYIEVAFPSGLKAVGEVIGEDQDSDLAVIHVDVPAEELHPLAVGNSDALHVGQYVVAIGNPFGLQGSMSIGIVSSLGRSLDSMNQADSGDFFTAGDLIQTDAAINPGNSGGPLLNLNGEVVGVNRAIRTFSSAEDGNALNSGIGFAVSSNIVARVVPSLILEGHFDYPYLGISSLPDLSLADAQDLGLERTDGALISNVAPSGPAAEAGLQDGDFIIAIDGIDINNFDEMISYLFKQKSPGEVVTLTVIRAGEEMDIELTLGARP
ncbi:MAG: trypsin-like peptidase domain-containing protein [Anaerolineales bacterium]